MFGDSSLVCQVTPEPAPSCLASDGRNAQNDTLEICSFEIFKIFEITGQNYISFRGNLNTKKNRHSFARLSNKVHSNRRRKQETLVFPCSPYPMCVKLTLLGLCLDL